jgi:hypothetical protein
MWVFLLGLMPRPVFFAPPRKVDPISSIFPNYSIWSTVSISRRRINGFVSAVFCLGGVGQADWSQNDAP